jgi:hypothetical protein
VNKDVFLHATPGHIPPCHIAFKAMGTEPVIGIFLPLATPTADRRGTVLGTAKSGRVVAPALFLPDWLISPQPGPELTLCNNKTGYTCIHKYVLFGRDTADTYRDCVVCRYAQSEPNVTGSALDQAQNLQVGPSRSSHSHSNSNFNSSTHGRQTDPG